MKRPGNRRFNFLKKPTSMVKKKTFIQIVNPITIRPRDGDAETGYMKLQKTVFTIRMGKGFIKSLRQKKNKGEQGKQRIDRKKAKFQFLKKTAWTIIGQQMPDAKPKKTGKFSLKTAQGLRKMIKKVKKGKGNKPPETVSPNVKIGKLNDTEHIKDTNYSMDEILGMDQECDVLDIISIKLTEKPNELSERNQNVVAINEGTELYKREPMWKIIRNVLSCYSYWSDKTQERKKIFLLPLPFPSDINGSGNFFRLWSCIWLAHLLHDAIEACPQNSRSLTPIWKHKRSCSINTKEFNIWKVLRMLVCSFKMR